MNRHALLSLGFLVTGLAAASPGCGGDAEQGGTSKAGDANLAGKDGGAGEANGGGGNVVKPMGGEGGVVESQGGNGGTPVVEGGTSSTMGGAVAAGAGGSGEVGGAGGAGGEEPGCVVGATYGNLGLIDGFTSVVDDPESAIWRGDLQVVPPYRGLVSVELYDGYAPFETGLKPVTNQVLAGDNLNFATCGLCVRLIEADENDDLVRVYMATAGTVTVTSVSGRITGSASGLAFEEVTIDDDYTSTPVPGGCKSAIAAVKFDESTAVGGAGGVGGAGN